MSPKTLHGIFIFYFHEYPNALNSNISKTIFVEMDGDLYVIMSNYDPKSNRGGMNSI